MHPPLLRPLLVFASSVLLGACAGTPGRGAPGRYALDLNSATNACRQNPLLCAKVAGEPLLLPPPMTVQVSASVGITGQVVVRVLKATEQARIEEVLTECSDMARSEVLIRHLGERRPTPEWCNEVLERAARGRPLTRAMLLGREMHLAALQCTEQKLDELLPGRFSLEPCYRFDERTGRVTLISPEERQTLLQQGLSCELVGSLRPDVVIHTGDPFFIQAVYDFKFPCVNTDRIPEWSTYPKGHPHAGSSQGKVYEAAFGPLVYRVVPRLGVIR